MYTCKVCGLPVWVAYQHGVVEMSIENGDKLEDVDRCPQCGNWLMFLSDLEFIPPKEKS